jgi:hypothetical protein
MQRGFALRTPIPYLAHKVTGMQERNSKLVLNVSKVELYTREAVTLFVFYITQRRCTAVIALCIKRFILNEEREDSTCTTDTSGQS